MASRKRFRNEREVRDFIKKELEKEGYGVGSEVRLEGVKVDLYAKKGNEFSVIEVKYRNVRGIPDDIGKCVRLSHSSDVDRTYVAAPAFVFPDEYIEMARTVGVGVYTVTEEGIRKEAESWVRPQAELYLGMSYSQEVHVGEEFAVEISVSNGGRRTARDVVLRYVPSDPFRRPKGAQNRRVIDELESRASVRYPFRVAVRPRAKPGKYPLFITVSAHRIAERTSAVELTVKERPHREQKGRKTEEEENRKEVERMLEILEQYTTDRSIDREIIKEALLTRLWGTRKSKT